MTSVPFVARETPDEGSTDVPGSADRSTEPRLHAVKEGLAALIEERRAEIAAAQGAPTAEEID